MDPRLPPPDGDRNLGPVFASLAVVTAALGCGCVLLRVFIRVKWTRSFGWDDAFIIAALLITIPETLFNVLSVVAGAGRHQFYLTFAQISDTIKWNTSSQIVNVPLITLTKISILLFIFRIQNKSVVAWMVYLSGAATLAINIPTMAVLAAQCRPLAGRWDPRIPATCLSIHVLEAVGWAQGAVSGIIDLLISISPVVILWGVQMKPRTKFGICALMSLGLIATAANFTRTALIGTLSDADYTFDTIGIAIASVLEANLGIIAACIPTMKPFFRWVKAFIRTRRAKCRKPARSASKTGTGMEQDFPRGSPNYNRIMDAKRKNGGSNVRLQQFHRDFGKNERIVHKQMYEVESSEGNSQGSGSDRRNGESSYDVP